MPQVVAIAYLMNRFKPRKLAGTGVCAHPDAMVDKFNVPNLQRHMRSNISIIKAAAKRLGAAHP